MCEQKKLTKGDTMPDLTFDSPFEKGLSLYEVIKGSPKTAVLFLRYYGCTLCQYDMHVLAEKYDEITADGGKVLVALQSKPELIAQDITKDTFPFTIICDPKMSFYKQFDIQPAKSKIEMTDAGTMVKITKAMAAGYEHGEYEGDEMQLPACFVIEPSGFITYAHYGKSVGDIPTPSQLKDLLK